MTPGGSGTSSETRGSKKGRRRVKYDPTLLYPLDGAPKRHRIITWDIESKDGPTDRSGFTRPFMVGMYDGKHYLPFFDQTEGGDWKHRYHEPGGCVDRFLRTALSRAYRGAWFYAHNAGNFDFLFLLPWLRQNADELGLVVSPVLAGVSGLLCIDVWKGEKKWHRWRFVDSVRLLPMSLDKAAKTFGVGRKYAGLDGETILDAAGRPFDLRNHPTEDDPGWCKYNESDCRLLYGVLDRTRDMVENVFGGELGLTAPSTAIRTFRRQFLDEPIERDVHTHAFIRESYAGGRTELFRQHGRWLSYFDVNSSYPHSMTSLVPAGGATEWQGEPPESFLRDRIGFVRAVVRVPDDCPVPPLPLRAAEQWFPRGSGVAGKLVFPVGVLEGVWEWSELSHAVESCGVEILEWKDSVWYHGRPLLAEFVETLYKYRDKLRCFTCRGKLGTDASDPFWCDHCRKPGYDEGLAAWAKLLANSTYGRFAMNLEREVLWWRTDPNLPDGALPLVEGDDDCQLWVSREVGDDPAIMPQISARITARSRVTLHKYALVALGRANRQCRKCHSKVTFAPVQLSSRTWLSTDGGSFGVRVARARQRYPLLTEAAEDCGGFGPHGEGDAAERIGPMDRSCPCGGALETFWGTLYYMDTDSIIVDVAMPTGSELGMLKDEIPRYSGYLDGQFYAPKLYRLSVDPSYVELPEQTRRRMLERDGSVYEKIADDERAIEEALAGQRRVKDAEGNARTEEWDVVRAKGIGRELRTKENLEILYRGALRRLEWLADPDNHGKTMPPSVETAGTIYDRRLEKFRTLARLVKRDERNRPVYALRADGTFGPVSDAFGRGPLMTHVPRRLHLDGAKRSMFPNGNTEPYRIDMSADEPEWWRRKNELRRLREDKRRREDERRQKTARAQGAQDLA